MRSRYIVAAALAAALAVPALGQGFDAEAATRAYLATVNGAARAKSDAYFEGGYWLILWGALVTVAITLAFLHFGWAARLSGWASRVTGGRRWLAVPLWVLGFFAASALLSLPWDIWTGFVREHDYGLSTQSLGAWFGDWAKGAAISLVMATLLLVVLLWLVRRLPRSWWVWSAAVTMIFVAIGTAVAPVYILPLFNKFTAMPASPLQAQLLAMAHGNGVNVRDILVVDESTKSKRVSANVSGLGSTLRVTLNDNLLAKNDPAMTRAITGHELGHYVLGHVVTRLLGFSAVILLGYLVVHLGVPALLARFGARWGVTRMDDPAIVAPAVLVFTLYILLATPLINTIVRFHETQADIFGLNAARAPDGFARAAMTLSTYRKLEPGPFEEVLFYDHPSGYTRVHMSMVWKAAHLGEPGVD